jgi:hypothetical protein
VDRMLPDVDLVADGTVASQCPDRLVPTCTTW